MAIWDDAWDWAGGAVSDVGDWMGGAWDTLSGVSNYDANARRYTATDPTREAYSGYLDPQREQFNLAGAINRDTGAVNQDLGSIRGTAGDLSGLAIGPGGMVQDADSIRGLSAELGAAPSAAEAASRVQASRLNQDAMARAGAARGANSALMLREQGNINAGLSRNAAADASAAAVAEQNARYGQRAGMLGQAAGVRGQAGQTLGAAGNLYGTAGAQGLTMRGQNVQREQGAADRSLDYRQNRAANNLQSQQITASSQDAANQAAANIAGGNAQRQQQAAGGVVSAIGGVLGSDIRAKTDVSPVDPTSGALDASMQAAQQTMPDPRLDRMIRTSLEDRSDMAGPGAPAPTPQWAKRAQAQAAQQQDSGGGFLSGAGGFMSSLGGSLMSDKNSKEQIRRLTEERDALQDRLSIFEPRQTVNMPPQWIGGPAGTIQAEDMADKSAPQRVPSTVSAIASNPDANREALGPMGSYQFRYKPEAAARFGQDTEPRIGIMADEMDDSPAGRAVVRDTPDGKVLDQNRAISFSLAGLAGIDKRLREVEGRR